MMLEKIGEMIKDAMRAKEKARLDSLRYLKSMLLENKTSVKPIGEMDVIIKHHKKLVDSKEFFKSDAEKLSALEAEIKVIEEFLPKQLEEEEVIKIIEKIRDDLENPQMGTVMKELSGQIKGRFNGKRASELVKSILN